jgi:hypothetical protein
MKNPNSRRLLTLGSLRAISESSEVCLSQVDGSTTRKTEAILKETLMPIELETTIITVIVAFIVGLLTAATSYIIGSRQLKQNDEKTHRELELELNRFREEQKQWLSEAWSYIIRPI